MEVQLEDHQIKCRCCLKAPTSRSIEISRFLAKRFEELTKIKLVMTDQFSSIICVTCNSKLAEFFDFQSELVENQKVLYKFVEEQNVIDSLKGEVIEEIVVIEEELTVKRSFEEYQIEALDESLLEKIEPPRKKLKSSADKAIKKTRKVCQLCGLSFATNGWYHHMLRAHTADPRFVCDFCLKGFRVKHDLKDHIQTHMNRESRKKHHCAFCPAVLLSKSAVKNHEHIFHSDIIEEHPCECGKIFSSRMKLYQHRSTVHTKGHFPCSHCEKIYTVKNALQKHVIKNHGEKKACEICGKLFAPGMFMNRHLKSHGPPQYICTFENCCKEFHSRSALGYHEESHKPQAVTCTTCNAQFTSVRNLNRHVQRQHSNVRVQCEIEGCSHTAARKDYLAAHYRSHKDIDEEIRNTLLEKIKEIKVIPW